MLAKEGYNVVRLPRTGIEPLDIIGRDIKGNERLGQLSSIWRSDAQAPQIRTGSAGNVKTVTSSTLKASIGLRVLDNILSALGAAVPRLDFAYGHKSALQFSIGNVQLAEVEPTAVGIYLTSGDLQTGNPFVDRYFLDDDTEAFVITQVLKSNSVTVIASSGRSTGVGVDVKAIQDVVGADVKVEAAQSNQSTITYTGKQPLTFGFKAFQIVYEFEEARDDNPPRGRWWVRGVDPADGRSFLSTGGQNTPRGVLLAEREGRIGRVELR